MARARARRLSDVQVAWLHKLATEAKERDRRTPVRNPNGCLKPEGSAPNIVRMLTTAAGAGKKFLAIRLEGGLRIALHTRGTYEGSAGIYRADKSFAGVIQSTGALLSKNLTSEELTLLRHVDAHPADGRRYDTFLLLGNNLGLIEGRERAPVFLAALAAMARPGAQIIPGPRADQPAADAGPRAGCGPADAVRGGNAGR